MTSLPRLLKWSAARPTVVQRAAVLGYSSCPLTTLTGPKLGTQKIVRHPLISRLVLSRSASTSLGAAPKRTALYDLHLEHGGTMVPFGGYEMPVQYTDLSIGESHKWTREKASIFDVGHM